MDALFCIVLIWYKCTVLEGGQMKYVIDSLKCLILGSFHTDISTHTREVEPKALSFA
jgi:hypothetical protein